jgi:hypothetical protein
VAENKGLPNPWEHIRCPYVRACDGTACYLLDGFLDIVWKKRGRIGVKAFGQIGNYFKLK